ncbi:sensor histidine kinase [Flavihumibacter fluvii]|uniref:sensor histidine kinase n=1 Tax=Flavihumibacter fluvii TaxID=2838157 RepID=UPI001BDF0F6D|nr:histidine kinase [Flavihumibacter fluvii]ULQ53174.1 histidine kinase [Flavihumibacter fluvii]
MKFFKPHRLEWYSFLFSMPLVAVAANLILYKERFWTDIRVWLISFPLIFVIGTLSWYSHTCYDNFIENKFPELNQSRLRIGWKAMVIFLIMSPSILLIFLTYDFFHILGYNLQQWDLMKGLLLGLSVNLIFETLYEADYILNKFKEGVAEKELLQELSIQQEFDTLKNQVNPHFLFNCFNTLSSLISVDKEKAEQFLDELSKVYRYLLKNNEDGLSTLESEIKFIDSYYQLLRTRHSDSVQLNIEIDKQYYHYLLPSLSLQLLVENAVKHNAHSKSNPLIVDIFTTAGNKLVVSNNLQPRTIKAQGTKVGLNNIRAKFDLLRTPGFQVLDDEKNFTVVLPLRWKNTTR